MMNKLQGNKVYIEQGPNPAVHGFEPINLTNDPSVMRSIRIEVYKGKKYLGKKIFSQNRIIIGKTLEADLVLSDDEIADKHACITYVDEQLVILDQTQKSSLLIKGGLYGISIIHSSEQVGVGPYTLNISRHIKNSIQESTPHVGCDNNPEKKNSASFRVDLQCISEGKKVDPLEKDSEVIETIIKSENDEAAQIQAEPMKTNNENVTSKDDHSESEITSFVEDRATWKFYGLDSDEEDEAGDEDCPADFLLKDKIDDINLNGSPQNLSSEKYLEIIKLRGDDVVDIRHLEEKGRFYISNDRGKRFCLAEVKGSDEVLFSFNKNLQGHIEDDDRRPIETRLLMKDENCISKRKKVYRSRVPQKGKVLISDGYFSYQLRIVGCALVPQASEIRRPQKKSYRHFGVSIVFHLVFLTFLGLFPSFESGKEMEEETRFVKLDATQLGQLENVVNSQPKPAVPKPVVKPKSKERAEPKVIKKKPVRVASKKKPSKTKKASKPSRHPNAGGGFGDGNVATRNVNEKGILGMLSDSVGI